MPNPRRLTIFLPLALAILASGCGASETSSTSKAASVTTTTSAPANTSPSTQTAVQSTGATGTQRTSTAPVQTTTAPLPKKVTLPSPAVARKLPSAVPPNRSVGHNYPLEFQQRFIAAWETANGSKSSAECIIAKFEALSGELGRSLGELVGTERAVLNHTRFSRRARQFATECHSSIT